MLRELELAAHECEGPCVESRLHLPSYERAQPAPDEERLDARKFIPHFIYIRPDMD